MSRKPRKTYSSASPKSLTNPKPSRNQKQPLMIRNGSKKSISHSLIASVKVQTVHYLTTAANFLKHKDQSLLNWPFQRTTLPVLKVTILHTLNNLIWKPVAAQPPKVRTLTVRAITINGKINWWNQQTYKKSNWICSKLKTYTISTSQSISQMVR